VLGGGILCGFGLLGSTSAGAADGFTVTPGVSASESFNDNVNLAPKGSEQSAWITMLSPSISVTDDSSRLKLNLSYAPQGIFYYGDVSDRQLNQALQAYGEATLFPEVLFFDIQSSISQQFVNGTGPIAATTLTTSNNLQTVEAFTAGPIMRNHLGSYADSETRYTYGVVSTSGNVVPPLQTNELRQAFTGGDYFGRLGWTVAADYLREDYQSASSITPGTTPAIGTPGPTGGLGALGGTAYRDENVSASPKYAIYNGLSLLATIGYEHIVSPGLTIPSYEIFWNGGFEFNPNERTNLTLTYGQRYGIGDLEINGRWDPGPQTHLTLSYSESVETSQSLISNSLNQLGTLPGGQLGNTSTGLPFTPGVSGLSGIPGSPLGVTGGAFIFKGLQATATSTRERNTYQASVYYQTDQFDTPPSTQRLYGAALNWNRQLKPELTSSLGGSYNLSTFGSTGIGSAGGREKIYTLNASLNYSLSQTASTQLTVTRSGTQGTIAQGATDDDIITLSFQKRF
jgi:uncharacterized protein (PEP-CTERM system associated)